MEKWADYVITQARYTKEHDHIISVKAYPDRMQGFGDVLELYRHDLLTMIFDRKTFSTTFPGDHGWVKGSEVHLLKTGKAESLRTDQKHEPSDLLENVPEY